MVNGIFLKVFSFLQISPPNPCMYKEVRRRKREISGLFSHSRLLAGRQV
jgi:hypothetical protein